MFEMRGGSEMSKWDDNLTSHVPRHHPQLLSKTQFGAETIKETPKVKKLDGTLMSFIVIFLKIFFLQFSYTNKCFK